MPSVDEQVSLRCSKRVGVKRSWHDSQPGQNQRGSARVVMEATGDLAATGFGAADLPVFAALVPGKSIGRRMR